MFPPKHRFVRFICSTIFIVLFTFAFHAFQFAQTRSYTGTYSENFNSLLNTGAANTWTNDVTIDGWQSSLTAYAADDGTSNNGGLYSYGNTASADRALGSLASPGTNTINFGVCFTNSTGSTVSTLAVNYTGEQWRVGSTPALGDTISFSYQTGVNSILAAGVWTSVTALNFASPTITPNNAPVNGNVVPNRIVISPVLITGLNIPNGTDFCFRWSDLDNTGADYGASIDDFSVTPGTTAATANVRGRIVNEFGRGLSRSSVRILNAQSGETRYARTNSFGYFNFLDLTVGDFYIVEAQRKGYDFGAPTSFQLIDELTDLVISGRPYK
jgi:Carboxypeptidase regulatory-like domain